MAETDFLSSSSSLSLKSSRLPISAGLTLIRLARLCMSSSLRNKQTHTKTLLMINNMKLLRDNLSASNNKRHQCGKTDSRRFPLAHKDTRQRQLERGLHHFDRQRLQLQRQVGLRRRRTGEPLQVDVGGRQNLTMPLVLLQVTDRNKGSENSELTYLELLSLTI